MFCNVPVPLYNIYKFIDEPFIYRSILLLKAGSSCGYSAGSSVIIGIYLQSPYSSQSSILALRTRNIIEIVAIVNIIEIIAEYLRKISP